MKKERDINIELLRIMAMFLVLAYHSNISIGQISVAELNKDFFRGNNTVANQRAMLYMC